MSEEKKEKEYYEKYEKMRQKLEVIFRSKHAYKVLRIIEKIREKKGEVGPSDVSKKIDATDQGIRKIIEQLINAGLVIKKVREEKVGRTSWYDLKLTDNGKKIVDFIDKMIKEFPEDLLNSREKEDK